MLVYYACIGVLKYSSTAVPLNLLHLTLITDIPASQLPSITLPCHQRFNPFQSEKHFYNGLKTSLHEKPTLLTVIMQTNLPPSQLNRPDLHPRENHHLTHPSREPRPPSIFHSRQPQHIKKKPAAVPFNRLQLAAALIEYNDSTSDHDTSGIDWSLQEHISRPLSTYKQAPYSAIFIPFRQTLPSKPLDFFTGLELPASPPKSAGVNSFSGFGIVSETGATKLATTVPGVSRRISEPVVIEHAQATGSRYDINPFDNDTEVLSEWGLDKVLSGNLEKPTSPHSAQISKPPAKTKINNNNDGVPPNVEHSRQRVKSDMFDFHFSELRLLNQDEGDQLGKTLLPDFFDDNNNLQELNPVIDDEAMLRQRVGCDPEGRKLLRPQSVMELKEAHLHHLPNKKSTAQQLAVLRGRAPHVAQQGFSNSNHPSQKAPRRSTSRPISLSPARAVSRASMSALKPTTTQIPPIRQRSASGAIQTLAFASPHSSSLPRGRRKSVLDEPSNRRFSFNPLQATLAKRLHQRVKSTTSVTNPSIPQVEKIGDKQLSTDSDLATEFPPAPISPALVSPNPIAEHKSKGRTSADIAERYQKSIAMLEGRKSEDMTYDVPNRLSSSLGASQADKDAQGTSSRDHPINVQSQVGSNRGSQQGTEFSLGAPKTFTSRFDPKVASVLSQATPTGISLHDGSEDRSLHNAGEDDYDEENGRERNDDKDSVTETHIYDEHGRIRFPASLKPLVLIMPIPLTPAQPEPEEDQELDSEMAAADEAAQAEKAKLEEIQRLKNVRPAGKLYGRSLIDELNSRKGNQKSKQMAFGANQSPQNFNQHLSPEDASRPGSIYSMRDAVPEVRVMLPHSSSSPIHLANQARQTTQSKFSQALINSSKARKSVFGMDMVMKAELEKLKKIKAMEEQELREEESKIQAKEAKKQAKKKGKKKAGEEEAMKNDEPKGRLSSRLSRMDNWDAVLEKETQLMPTDMDLEDEVGFGHADTLARRLELQVEEMKYTPLPNLFESHQMVRPNSVQSQAAFLSRGTRSNTPNFLMTSPREDGSENHELEEELVLNRIEEHDDNVPLSQHRKSNLLDVDAGHEEEDNRPLSHIGAQLGAGSAHSSRYRSYLRPASIHDSDEELPLGIRASILLSKKHPPIDLTHDGSSSEGPIGSVASDDSDMVPLGLRASAFFPLSSKAARTAGDSSSSHEDDIPLAHRASRMPGGDSALQGKYSSGRNIETLANSGKSIGGQSDDVPLGVKRHDHGRLSTMNPTFSFPSQAATFNNPYQTSALRVSSNPNLYDQSANRDDDDDVPLAQRASALPPIRSLKEGSAKFTSGQEILVTPSESDSPRFVLAEEPVGQRREPSKMRSPIPSQVVDETVARQDTLAALEGRGNTEAHADDDVPLGVTRAAHSTTSTLQRERTTKRQKARERNLEAAKAQAELEALINDGQKPSGDGKPMKAKAEATSTIEEGEEEEDEDDDDDDVPLGLNAQASMMNFGTKKAEQEGEDSEEDDVPLGMVGQTAMMQQLVEQQNAAFGLFGGGHQMSLGFGHHPISTSTSMGLLPYPLGPTLISPAPPPFQQFHLPLLHPSSHPPNNMPPPEAPPIQDSTISRWRQDVQ
ncbi:hypothetical protein VP01_2556g5 [Puccinia sorghi]|uniref:Uncharacterized protein n=1 Tax=Puccinia sorghi TaxID=27349 RepID=A0A0L6V5T9_9BASI|nr:hypothetical protein VP01_2556g5 [Puccinia sorghi]